jgi:hypothetical protein
MEVLFGQTLLKGKVTDASNGDALMSALITVDNTTDSTQTNFDGEFELRTLQALPLTITIQYSGYNPFSINIIDQSLSMHNLSLKAYFRSLKWKEKVPPKKILRKPGFPWDRLTLRTELLQIYTRRLAQKRKLI